MKGLLADALGHELELRVQSRPELALAAEIVRNGKTVGLLGQLWPAEAKTLDATAAVVFAEMDLSEWLRAPATNQRYVELPRFPAVARDIALVATQSLRHEQIAAALTGAKEPLLTGVRLFDLFSDATGEKIAADKKSLAYSLTYRSPERTLTADEVNAAHARLKERLVRELGVQFRE